METTNSQITFLEKFLWEHLKADQEPLEEFAQRINGAYFSHHDIDFDPAALTSWDDIPIPGSPGEIDERQKLSFFVCTANVIFLGQEIPEARKRRKDIVRRVTAIVQDHPEANRYKNDILTACLSLLVVEKDLKDYAHFRRTRQIPVHAESVQKYCKGVEQATQI